MSSELLEILERFDDFVSGQNLVSEDKQLDDYSVVVKRKIGSLEIEELIPRRLLILEGYLSKNS
jgi:hypothetical protein